MTQKLQNTSKKFSVLRESDTDAVLEIMSKERPIKMKTRQNSSMSKGHRLGEANATF